MARARNIKPALFKNELLGVADPMLTLLFQSLWCLADKAGRMEDRPLRIKAETFPYRDGLDVNVYLTELQQLGFIRRYSVSGVAYIQVVNFLKHQNPHKTERESEIPEFAEESDSCTLTVIAPLINGSRPADSLIPDSLIPDPLQPLGTSVPGEIDEKPDAVESKAKPIDEDFEQAWSLYPKRHGGNPKGDALKAWNARKREGITPAEMIAGTERYVAHLSAAGKIGTEFVMQAVRFFGTSRQFAEAWPVAGTKAGQSGKFNGLNDIDHTSSREAQQRSIEKMGIKLDDNPTGQVEF